MTLRFTGLLLALLLPAWWAWRLRDPCGPQSDAWQQCQAHHRIAPQSDDAEADSDH